MAEREALQAVLVEAFTNTALAGNGAAVVLLQEPVQEAWMQGVARSLAQSETAFLLQAPQGWLLRWFTPHCEVDLCGHATLAALLALGHWGRLARGESLSLHSRSGPLQVSLDPHRDGWGSLVLPSSGLRPEATPQPLLDLLAQHGLGGAEGFWTSALGYSVALLSAEADLIGLPCPAHELQGALRQGLVLMQALNPAEGADRSLASRRSAPPSVGGLRADYQLRFFAPGLGIPEDPVTGSAHALVAPWWQQRLGRSRVVGWQCSDRPGGMVCEAASSGMIRLFGSGHRLWDGILRTASGDWSGPADPTPGCEELWRTWRTVTRCG